MYDLPSPQYLVIRLRKDPVRKSDSMTYRSVMIQLLSYNYPLKTRGDPPRGEGRG